MKLTLVRHGAVDEHFAGCYNGHNDIGLSEKGKVQAEALAEAFAAEHFDAVYCSDLPRARETLLAFRLQTPPCFSEALREKSWGRHEGMRFEEISTQEGVRYENFRQWLELLDGERVELFMERVGRFFTELEGESHASVLVMTHAGVIRTLYALTQKVGLEEAFGLNIPHGSYVEYDYETNRFGGAQCAG